ncbi:helix-turn-helix domain-containing protein [Actinokineospora pegani]|uniref:helix-turn-helix domain-containing protein n=1 Tax=Actinokineospora pegani TaxID=2654637 RepID=UPI002E253D37
MSSSSSVNSSSVHWLCAVSVMSSPCPSGAPLAATETLRQLREQRGWTMEEVATRLEPLGGKWSTSKISRIESRQQGVSRSTWSGCWTCTR